MRRVRLLSVTPNLDSSDWSRRAIWLDAATRIPRIVLQLLAANKGDSRGIKTTNAIIHGFFLLFFSFTPPTCRGASEDWPDVTPEQKKSSSCIQKLKDPPAFFFFSAFPRDFFIEHWKTDVVTSTLVSYKDLSVSTLCNETVEVEGWLDPLDFGI